MIIDICYVDKQEKRFNSLEQALLWACKLEQWFFVWVDGELWLNVVEFPDGTFRCIVFDS